MKFILIGLELNVSLLLARLMDQYCLHTVVCRLSSSSVVIVVRNAAGVRAGRPPAAGRVGGRHCTAGQYGYVPLGRHLVGVE